MYSSFFFSREKLGSFDVNKCLRDQKRDKTANHSRVTTVTIHPNLESHFEERKHRTLGKPQKSYFKRGGGVRAKENL